MARSVIKLVSGCVDFVAQRWSGEVTMELRSSQQQLPAASADRLCCRKGSKQIIATLDPSRITSRFGIEGVTEGDFNEGDDWNKCRDVQFLF